MKNEEVVEAFLRREEAKTKHLFSVRFGGGRMVLYSYGTHYPMALLLKDGTIFINCSYYSSSTSKQKYYLCNKLGYKNFKDLEEQFLKGKEKPKDIFLKSSFDLIRLVDNLEINTKEDYLIEEI